MKQRKNKEFSIHDLCQSAVRGMQEKKASDIVVLDLQDVKNAIADYFIICTGNSDTHINAIAEAVVEEVKKATFTDAGHLEGKTNREWILIDYMDVVVHVFNKDKRAYYDLENLWGDATLIKVDDMELAENH